MADHIIVVEEMKMGECFSQMGESDCYIQSIGMYHYFVLILEYFSSIRSYNN